MTRNTPEAPSVVAIDARSTLMQALDDQVMTLESRNRTLDAQIKQLTIEREANTAAITIARTAIEAANISIAESRELALAETQERIL